MKAILKFGFIFPLIYTIGLLGLTAERTNPKKQSEELGSVSWYRDYNEAIKLAEQEHKSVLILFQEIPGCVTCRDYGNEVLTNPLMVEAIENLFIPLAVYNNKGGKDREILDQFHEPSWNNPVVRIINSKGNNVIPRLSGNYSSKGLYRAMKSALIATNDDVPEYFKLLGKELSGVQNAGEAYYKMYCFWTGEKELGSREGVLKTEAGFMGGHEVVKVQYDKKQLDKTTLTKDIRRADIFPIADDGGYRFSEKDHLFHLQRTDYKFLPLSDLQKTKINSAIGSGKDARKFLSPKQLEWLRDLRNSNTKRVVLVNQSIAEAWKFKTS